jgi:hypothetical protein
MAGFDGSGIPRATMQNVAHVFRDTRRREENIYMAATTLFTCLCGRQKQTSNHWILARITSNGITFMPWDWDMAMNSDIIVLCGEGCASALFSRCLGEWKRPVHNVTVNEPELAVA